jgi:hypothetical protein
MNNKRKMKKKKEVSDDLNLYFIELMHPSNINAL